jgi:methylated-DNA-[protein]-cysteine S-methyltransferase
MVATLSHPVSVVRCNGVTASVYPHSPIGPLTIFTEPGGITGLAFGGRPGAPAATGPVTEQLDAYFARELRAFDLPLVIRGSDEQRAVWAALREIPWGETRSYGEITLAAGRPMTDVRVVAATIGRTPIPVIVPCHRVIGADGSLTGYGGGLDRKRTLLELESPVLSLL